MDDLELIKGRLIKKITDKDNVDNEISSLKEMQKSILENNVDLQALKSQAEPLLQAIKEKQKEIKSTLEYKNVALKIRDYSEDKKQLESELSELILEIYKITGEKSIFNDGEEIKFKIIGKL